jgi:hypothetical protein
LYFSSAGMRSLVSLLAATVAAVGAAAAGAAVDVLSLGDVVFLAIAATSPS